MSFRPAILFTALFLCAGIIMPRAYAQREITDTLDMSVVGKNAKADQLFFDAVKAKMHDDDRLAEELLQKYILQRQDVPAAYYELARLSYGDRNLAKAEEFIKKAIELNPENKWYREEYAAILADRGAYAEAAKVMAVLMQDQPQDDNYPLAAADYYTRAKMYDEAIACLDKALLKHVMDADLLERKVQVYLMMNDVEKAAEVVKQKISTDPKNGQYYKQLGDLYSNNKETEKASEVYRNAERLLPNDPDIQLGIALNYRNAGNIAGYNAQIKKVILNKDLDADKQVEVFSSYMRTLDNDSAMGATGLPILREMTEQHPDDPDVLVLFGDFLSNSGQHDSAVVVYKRSLQIKQSNFGVWERLMVNYADKKYADSLIKYSERAMRLFPNLAIVSYYNALGYLNKKQFPQAIRAIGRAIDMQPDKELKERKQLADMYAMQADIYHSNKQDDLSDKSFDKSLSIDPDNASTLNNYSYYLSERGTKLDQAEEMSKKSLEIRPDEATFLDTYGWIQYKKGNYLKAKDYVERAIKLNGKNADATLYEHLGDICFQLNDKANAIENWKKAKALGAEGALIDKKISEGKLYE